MEKIMATVNYGKHQITQTWDFIPRDEEANEDAILITSSFDNGDIIGIPLDAARIKEIPKGLSVAQYNYSGTAEISESELIRRVGNPN